MIRSSQILLFGVLLLLVGCASPLMPSMVSNFAPRDFGSPDHVLPQFFPGSAFGSSGYGVRKAEADGCVDAVNVALLEMNFEGSAATDSCTGDVAALTGSYDADCSAGNCPLVDSLSGYITDTMTLTDLFPGGAERDVTLDFVFELEDDTKSTINPFAVLIDTEPLSWSCLLALIPSTGALRVYSNDYNWGDGSAGDIETGTAYNIRLEYDGDLDICTVWVDTHASGNWGVGGVTNALSVDGSSTNVDTIGYVSRNVGTTSDYVIDQIGACDSLGLTGKCGRESE